MFLQEPLPPIPSVSIDQIFRRRDAIAAASTALLGHCLVGSNFQALVDKFHQKLPQGVLRQTIQGSLKSLLGKTLDIDLLLASAWRLAGNVSRLQQHEAVPEWNGQKTKEWVAAEIYDIVLKAHANDARFLLTFRVLSGSAVAQLLYQTWTNKKLQYLATFKNEKNHGFGFNRPKYNARGEQRSRNIYSSYKQFFRLRCFLYLTPQNSKAEPQIFAVDHNGATQTHNTAKIQARDRTQAVCIKDAASQLDCYNCPLGVANCIHATHATTYEEKRCENCQTAVWCDPSKVISSVRCLTCYTKDHN